MLSLLLFTLILIFNQVNTRFLLNSGSSSVIVLRQIQIPTDNNEYRIRCPYNLKYLMITSLNYSNGNCFELNSDAIHGSCATRRSPCRFQARSILLSCDHYQHSNHVDITYQCSFSSITLTNPSHSIEHEQIQITPQTTPSIRRSDTVTVHAFSFTTNSRENIESIVFFLFGIGIVFILWILACCIWFVRCDNTFDSDGGKCELLAHRPYHMPDIIDFNLISKENLTVVGNLAGHTSTGGLENLCLQINPLDENNLSLSNISSLTTTPIDL